MPEERKNKLYEIRLNKQDILLQQPFLYQIQQCNYQTYRKLGVYPSCQKDSTVLMNANILLQIFGVNT